MSAFKKEGSVVESRSRRSRYSSKRSRFFSSKREPVRLHSREPNWHQRELEGLRGRAFAPEGSGTASIGAGSASEGARLAPLKGAGKGANKGLEGVSTPKRARGAPRELPLIRSQEGSEEDPSLQKDPAQKEPEGPPKKGESPSLGSQWNAKEELFTPEKPEGL